MVTQMKRKPRAKAKPKPSPRPRGKGAPTGIGDVLAGLQKTTKLGIQLEQAKIWEHWETLAGPKLCQHGKPNSIRDGRLTVDVDTSVAMHRFTYRKYAIMRRINLMARKELVTDIFFRLAGDDDAAPPTST